ncbi:universal stress protein [Lentiprolixibacter aurantiacus]|uniref:Universal stress protein n=1 Tax=Lentiprolixibacter aurantiacus TaxID=2993939 RepID=A0AAE3SQ37_9FLAO|nr:universal stress protein [Lentiprolixibacter aurantiacus]MCX2720107.1 universal stress protein [Lentiprolixibacter aurantiacus]
MKKIIIPTDFSENSYHAFAYAAKLFQDEPCTFYLVHTFTPSIYQTEYVLHSPGQIGLGDFYQTDSDERLAEMKERAEAQFNNPRHTMFTHSAFNVLVDEVLDMVEKEKADLVIMGTQGATGAKEIFLGTHTVHVIKKAKCPVIAVPSDFEFKKPKELLFPTDFEVDYTEKHFSALFNIADLHKSRIEILHISTGLELTRQQKENKAKLESLIGSRICRYHDVPNQEIIEGINQFQKTAEVQLLAMIQNKHTFLERLFIEPVIKKIGFHVTIPFMVIPDET